MAVETLFSTEEKFYDLKFVTQIRRDPELGGEQLYLVDEIPEHDGQIRLSFVEALGDTDKNQINCVTFLKQQFVSGGDFCYLLGCAVDERERLLYVLFGFGDQNFLKFFHLRYQAPDKFGYRRIVVQEGHCVRVESELLCAQLPQLRMNSMNRLGICPATGRLVTGYMAALKSATFAAQLASFPADLVCHPKQQKAVVKGVIDRLPFMTPLQATQMELRSPVVSRSNHMLFWRGYHQYKVSDYDLPPIYQAMAAGIRSTPDDDGCVILRSLIPGHPVNGHLNQMKIDPVKLVKNFLPTTVFDNFVAQIPSTTSKHIFFGSHLFLLGHVNKYVVFCFHGNYILATKWPKEWYKLSELPAASVWKVLCIDKQQKWGKIDNTCLCGTDLYLKSQLGDAHVVRRMALGHKFKDYRLCAFCGKEENRKKRNKDGKRMSRLKVCRMCKLRNFHIFYSEPGLACHYCSDECQRKHWKEHKAIHKCTSVLMKSLQLLIVVGCQQ